MCRLTNLACLWPRLLGTRVAERQDVDNYRVADAMKKKSEPVKDEWGIYDPSQAGFAAVIRKLLEAEETAASPSSDSGPRTGKT